MTTYVTRAQLQAMVDACPDTLAGKRDRLLLVVLRALGGRPREVADRRCDDVIYCTGAESGGLEFRVHGEIVTIPVGEYTDHAPSDLLDDWTKAVDYFVLGGRNPGDPLFLQVTKDDRLTTRGHPCDLGGLNAAAVSQIVKRAAERAGLPGTVTARSLRGPVRQKVAR